MECFISHIPQPVWEEFSTRYYGHPLLEEHDQIHKELQSFLEIASEIVNTDLTPPAHLHSLNPYSARSPEEFLDADTLFHIIREELKHIYSLIDSLKSAILLPSSQACSALIPAFKPLPKTHTKRRRRKKGMKYCNLDDIPAKSTAFQFCCDFDYKPVESTLKARYVV